MFLARHAATHLYRTCNKYIIIGLDCDLTGRSVGGCILIIVLHFVVHGAKKKQCL